MRKDLIGAVSAAALLLSGAAWAQSAGGSASGTQSDRPMTTSPSTTPSTAPSTTSPATTSTSPADSQTSTRQMPGATAGAMKMDRTSAQQLLGKSVIGANGDEIGEVKDVVLDPRTGQAKQLIIGSGGFLGIGEKDIAVNFEDAQVQPGQDDISVASLSRDQVRDMPGFEYDQSTVSLSREGGTATGTTPATGAPTGR